MIERTALASRPISACIEMLFQREWPGGWRDRLTSMRDILTGSGGRSTLARAVEAGKLLSPGGRDDPFVMRLRACRAVGWIDEIEFWSWRNKDIVALERALGETGMALRAFSCEGSEHLADSASHDLFLMGLRDSLAVARRLGSRCLIVVPGPARSDVARDAQFANVATGLSAAAALAEDVGVTLVLEPVNSRIDHPGTLLDATGDGLRIVERVDHPAVRLLYDVYHSVTMGEDPRSLFTGGLGGLVGHVHLADAPGRREPGSGEIAWNAVLETLLAEGYEGAFGCEFRPTGGFTIPALSTPAMHDIRALAQQPPPIGGLAPVNDRRERVEP